MGSLPCDTCALANIGGTDRSHICVSGVYPADWSTSIQACHYQASLSPFLCVFWSCYFFCLSMNKQPTHSFLSCSSVKCPTAVSHFFIASPCVALRSAVSVWLLISKQCPRGAGCRKQSYISSCLCSCYSRLRSHTPLIEPQSVSLNRLDLCIGGGNKGGWRHHPLQAQGCWHREGHRRQWTVSWFHPPGEVPRHVSVCCVTI